MTRHRFDSLAGRYDEALHYMRNEHLPQNAPRPAPTCHWPAGNVECLTRYRDWLLSGGVNERVTNLYHVMMAGHVFGLTLKPCQALDPDRDLECALDYVRAKQLTPSWIKNCRNSLKHFRRFLRLERGLGEESQITPFDIREHAQGLPEWLVSELERYQKTLQRNWRTARLEVAIRSFWSKHGGIWRFLCTARGVWQFADLKRQLVLDYMDVRLAAGVSARSVNGELRVLHGFLLFLQEEGYPVPHSLLRIPGPKLPDPLPKHLTDEQVKALREAFERNVWDCHLASRRRLALLDRAAFYLLWQGGLRVGEVEELRLEDLDLGQKRLSVRDGKGRKDRTVYLADPAIRALQEYQAVRGGGSPGSSDHVFLYRNAALSKDLIRSRLKTVGRKIGVSVYPHRLRHTCATQLLNAGCRVTSIQRQLGHKKLNTTLVYARAYDQTVADDYFAAMQRVEQRLAIVPEQDETKPYEVVKVPERTQVLGWIKQLAQPELAWKERMSIAADLLFLFAFEQSSAPLPEDKHYGIEAQLSRVVPDLILNKVCSG